LDARAADITDAMKLAAASALAGLVDDSRLAPGYIIPDAFDPRIREAVSSAVKKAV
jgi:malate dehydrogenase (oxaloacetate-decarboxylating)